MKILLLILVFLCTVKANEPLKVHVCEGLDFHFVKGECKNSRTALHNLSIIESLCSLMYLVMPEDKYSEIIDKLLILLPTNKDFAYIATRIPTPTNHQWLQRRRRDTNNNSVDFSNINADGDYLNIKLNSNDKTLNDALIFCFQSIYKYVSDSSIAASAHKPLITDTLQVLAIRIFIKSLATSESLCYKEKEILYKPLKNSSIEELEILIKNYPPIVICDIRQKKKIDSYYEMPEEWYENLKTCTIDTILRNLISELNMIFNEQK